MENNSQAIELKGIARSLTKLGVQDGQCEDIVNLRLKDGSWRVSDDGKLVHTLPNNYTQLYVHTNVYHHLLGVLNGKLWYFADIDNDGETFTPLDTPVEICDVQGNVTIVQNGHLLTIISAAASVTTPLPLKGDEKEIKYAIFKTGTNEYKEIKVDPNGKQTDRELYPFGRVNFNVHKDESSTLHKFTETGIDMTYDSGNPFNSAFEKKENIVNAEFTLDYCRDVAKTMFAEQKRKNKFTRPFLVCAALKMYDNSFIYACPITLVNPNELANSMEIMSGQEFLGYYLYAPGENDDVEISTYYGNIWFSKQVTNLINEKNYVCVPSAKKTFVDAESDPIKKVHYTSFVASNKNANNVNGEYSVYKASNPPIFCAGAHINDAMTGLVYPAFQMLGYDLVISISSFRAIQDNPDVFQSLCVFVSPEVEIYDFEDGDSIGEKWISAFDFYEYYAPKKRNNDKIVHDLKNSNLFLLKEYSINELSTILDNPIVDLSKAEDNEILMSLTYRDQLTSEAFDRKSYMPKTAYQYNQKLHIANYKANAFYGYPIDFFHLHNHSVKVEEGAWLKGVLPNLVENNGECLQYAKEQVQIKTHQDLIDSKSPYFLVKVYIESTQGEQVVSRYIQAYDTSTPQNGRADFIEDLNPLLTYPDARAKKMEILYVSTYLKIGFDITSGIMGKTKTFELKPHPYLNIAYYISPDLKPIKLADFDNYNEIINVE